MENFIKLKSELKAPKSLYNDYGRYNYRSAEDILEAVKPLLVKYKLNLKVSDEVVLIGDRYYIKATATISGADFSESVCGWAREAAQKKGMDESQITGATSSYARKYALCGLLCLDDTKDADSTNTHDREERKPVTKAPKVIFDAIRGATKTDELKNIWDASQDYQKDMEFFRALGDKKKELQSAK